MDIRLCIDRHKKKKTYHIWEHFLLLIEAFCFHFQWRFLTFSFTLNNVFCFFVFLFMTFLNTNDLKYHFMAVSSSHSDLHRTFSHLAWGLSWACVPGLWLQSCVHQHYLVSWLHQSTVGLPHKWTPQRTKRKVQHPKPPTSVESHLGTWDSPHLQSDTCQHHPAS